ncbi:MAG: hypothetical protein CO119_00940 [Flavobacteriales bacterium CG_4_9_14_3_um_filter_40_17]|nr:MAG: hypothetical protein CO119_00940 [Flavobacteriales bacterium CG_4_9_14_3_um_filter_40_17]
MRKGSFYGIILIVTLLWTVISFGQNQKISGVIIDSGTDKPIDNVNVLNLSRVIGTISNEKGEFEIFAQTNDTLYFSFLGYKPIKVRVTNDWLRFQGTKIALTQTAFALEEVSVTSSRLTGYLEIDAKYLKAEPSYRYSISGLPKGYEVGSAAPNAMNRIIGSIFNPADLLYNFFGRKGKQFRKLKQMKESDEIRNLLQNKFDRETLAALLQLEKVDIDEILTRCNYSKEFIQTANDLQILDAMSSCYEEYKVLKRDN